MVFGVVSVFIISLVVKDVISVVQPIRPDYEFSSQADGFLKLHRKPASWDEARLRCYYEGGVLASPLNQSLTVAMKALMAKDRSPPSIIFTGIHSRFSFGDFVSVEGVPFYSMDLKWAPGEPHPTADPKEDCILMNANGDIADVSCKEYFPYICYKKAPENGKPSICGTHDKEYKYDFRTGSCYKVHRVGRTWSRGFMTCQAEGGHMAIINSDAEAQVMRELLKEHPEDTMFADHKHVASIGYQDWGERGSWWTIHGQELFEAGYAKWDQGAPDSKDSQFCGGINRNGKLNDIWCNNHTFPVICEVPITSMMDVRSLLLPENQQQ